MAAEVARDVRHDVRAGTPALKSLRMIVSLAATSDGKHRPRSIVFHDITAASHSRKGVFMRPVREVQNTWRHIFHVRLEVISNQNV